MTCSACEKELSFNEIGLNKKFNGNSAPLCMRCLAEKLGVTTARLEEKIAEYRAAGCTMFVAGSRSE